MTPHNVGKRIVFKVRNRAYCVLVARTFTRAYVGCERTAAPPARLVVFAVARNIWSRDYVDTTTRLVYEYEYGATV